MKIIQDRLLDGIEAVLFDLDGTLVDSMWMWGEIDREFLKEYGYQVPENLNRDIEGMSFGQTAEYFYRRFPTLPEPEKLKQIWTGMAMNAYRTQVLPKEGVTDFLELLGKRQIACGIATSNGRELVQAVLSALGWEKRFGAVITGHEVPNGKPAPDIYLTCAAQLQAKPAKCLVFEDVVPGIQAGLSAGMRVCAVYDESSAGTDEEKRALADCYIRDFTCFTKA